LGAFQYTQGGKVITLSYFQAPDEIFDDPQEAAIWARRAYEVAVQVKTSARIPARKSKPKR
jgi:DNA transformation protein